MSHVVMQASEWRSAEEAIRAEAELRSLFDAYARFEREDPSPWAKDRVPPPLVDFGKKHGLEWPLKDDARFLLKGGFADTAELLRVDRMVFFWGGGFDLGGDTLRKILRGLGAIRVEECCMLTIRNDAPDERVKELAAFLDDEDFEDQYEIDDGEGESEFALHTLTVVGRDRRSRLLFDDSGVQDWAFVAILPQLDGEDPSFA